MHTVLFKMLKTQMGNGIEIPVEGMDVIRLKINNHIQLMDFFNANNHWTMKSHLNTFSYQMLLQQ